MENVVEFLPERRISRAFDLSTFVSVGNAIQPFLRLIEGIVRVAPELPHPVVIQHGHTPAGDCPCLFVPFMSMDDFIQHVHRSELLIMHAGAGSLINAIEAGKIPVVMPRRALYGEHVNDHQIELARAMAETDRVIMANGPEDLPHAVREALLRQKRAVRSDRMENSSPPALISRIGQILSKYAE